MKDPAFPASCIKHWSFRCDPAAIDMARILRDATEAGAEVIEVVPGSTAKAIVCIRDDLVDDLQQHLQLDYGKQNVPERFERSRHPADNSAHATSWMSSGWTRTDACPESLLEWIRQARERKAAGVRTVVRCHKA